MSNGSTATEEQHDPQAAREHFSKGRKAEANLDRWTAIESYEQAFQSAPDDTEICFRLAYNLDLVGEESEALHLYEQACSMPAAPVNALMNLAVLYEDAGDYAKAERCLRLIVETDPNHARARLYLKDVTASRTMVHEDEHQRLRGRQGGTMDTPIINFELSARARNCLVKMDIHTLGDLLRTTEAQLMSYKNCGETTLTEIKNLLAQQGLKLGQAPQPQQSEARAQGYEGAAGEEAAGILAQPVEDLQLSVRARKALELLNIRTIGELIARTEAELLGIKNFGATSLEEIKEKLAEHNLRLRVLDEES